MEKKNLILSWSGWPACAIGMGAIMMLCACALLLCPILPPGIVVSRPSHSRKLLGDSARMKQSRHTLEEESFRGCGLVLSEMSVKSVAFIFPRLTIHLMNVTMIHIKKDKVTLMNFYK